jgi:HSP20 family protein
MKLVNVNHPGYRKSSVDQLLNDFFNTNSSTDRLEKKELHYSPLTNVFESDANIVIELMVPGFEKDQINLSVENNILTVKSQLAEKDSGDEEGKKELRYSRVEFQLKNFEKKFKLSEKLDLEKIQAEFKNGILTVTLAKKEEAVPVTRKIEIL